jgi:hypothetical protein
MIKILQNINSLKNNISSMVNSQMPASKTTKKEDKRAALALSVYTNRKTKNDNDKQRQKLKGDILLLSNSLLNDKKINKSTYNKMYDLFLSSSRINALEDAYKTLININNTKEGKSINKAEFHEMKSNEKIKREKKEGKEDKFMMMIRSKNKNKKPLQTYHLTAIIKRSIHYPDRKTGNVRIYREEDHSRLIDGHDTLTDSRAVEASSLHEAHNLMIGTINVEQVQEEYSGHATVHIDSIQFIDDPVVESQITSSDVRQMPLRQCVGHLEYNFTAQETKYLSYENTCVIDNLAGLYGNDFNIGRDDIIKLNKEFHGVQDDEPEYIESDLGDMIINPKYNNSNELKNAEAKLKQYKEEYIKIKTVEVNDFKRKIFNILKCNLDHDNNEKMNVLKIKLKQHETLYKLCKSKLNETDDTKYIKYHNDCVLKIAKLKHMIKLKSELTNDDEIIIDKKILA